jgi:hypothetical protein
METWIVGTMVAVLDMLGSCRVGGLLELLELVSGHCSETIPLLPLAICTLYISDHLCTTSTSERPLTLLINILVFDSPVKPVTRDIDASQV